MDLIARITLSRHHRCQGYVLSAALIAHLLHGLKKSRYQVLRLEDVSVGIMLERAAKESGHETKIVSSARFCNEGCAAHGFVSHYIKPKTMRCLWRHLEAQSGKLMHSTVACRKCGKSASCQ